MGFFKKPPAKLESLDWLRKTIKSPIPLEHFDIEKRYDIYISVAGEYRLYANARLIALKTLDDIKEVGSALRAFLEIESSDGTRTMIPTFPIHAICEHGAQMVYTVLKKAPE